MIVWRALQAAAEFVLGLALLCTLATLAVVAGVLISTGFVTSFLLAEATEMWGTLRASIRSGR